MYKVIMFLFIVSISGMIYSQTASDYYNKPNQEIYASISQKSTYTHNKGFMSCFNSIYNWVNKSRAKYNFLSVTTNDSLGIVRVTSIFNCRGIFGDSTRRGDTSVCNLIITSYSGCLKIGLADIESRQDCGALQRVSIQKELVRVVEQLPDSVATVSKFPHISKGVGDSGYLSTFDVALEKIRIDSLHKVDSVRVFDSISRVVGVGVVSDDVLFLDSTKVFKAQLIVDSISTILDRDSVAERKQALIMFKGQLDLRKSISVETKLECVEFLIAHSLRSSSQVSGYLDYLSRLCQDRQDIYYAARLVVDPSHKYMCVRAYKKAQDEYSRVQVCRGRRY